MTELELQGEYVMDFFCRRNDGLGFREVKNNAVTSDLFIPADLKEFLKENSRVSWNNLLKRSDYNGDEQKLIRDIMDDIRRKIETSANVAIFLNSTTKNKPYSFGGETLKLLYVSGTELRGDEDFEKNIFSAVEEMTYSFHHEGKRIFAFRPDLSFFINGIFLGYAELKSNFTNQTAKNNGRNKIITDYLEAVWEYTKIANGNDVQQSLRRTMLRPFEKSIHLVTTDINNTYILRNPGQFFDDVKKGFQENMISISSFRPIVEKVFKPLPTILDEKADPRIRFEEAMRSLYSKKMVEKEILYYNFMAYTYKTITVTENGRKVQKKEYKDKTGKLMCPRPKQKFGCDRIIDRVQEFLDHESEPNYYIEKLRAELVAMNAPQDLIERVVAERDSYCNNKYVYSLLLQYAAVSGFETEQDIPTGLMAAEQGHPLFRELLEEYDGIHFVLPDGTYDMTPNVVRITRTCLKYGFVPNNQLQTVHGFTLLPKDYLCPKSYSDRKIHLTPNSLCIHHFAGSWLPLSRKKKLVYAVFGKKWGESICGQWAAFRERNKKR